jgi:hypothetical protein
MQEFRVEKYTPYSLLIIEIMPGTRSRVTQGCNSNDFTVRLKSEVLAELRVEK